MRRVLEQEKTIQTQAEQLSSQDQTIQDQIQVLQAQAEQLYAQEQALQGAERTGGDVETALLSGRPGP